LSVENRKLFYNAFYPILTIVVLSGATVIQHLKQISKISKRAARLILDLDCLTPSALLINTLKRMAFPE